MRKSIYIINVYNCVNLEPVPIWHLFSVSRIVPIWNRKNKNTKIFLLYR